jgi:N-acyl-L-homoserine lactone synthetase
MIENNNDRMSVNIVHSLDRIVSRLEDQLVNDLFNFFIIYQINQDQLVIVSRFVETDRPVFSKSIFSSLISGNEVSLT